MVREGTKTSTVEGVYVLEMRFGVNAFEDAMGELTKLRQSNTVKAYQERFEELANCTMGLTEEFFESCFVSGLRDDNHAIKAGVQMFQPSNITQATELAQLQKESFEAVAKRSRVLPKPPTSGWTPMATTLTIPKPLP